MQGSEVGEDPRLDDDMVDGDLGDGLRSRSKPSSNRKKSPSCSGLTGAEFQVGDVQWIPGRGSFDGQHGASWKLLRPAGPLVDLSKDELKDRLQEATETIDVLCCELEAAHRYLEGKYEALKILQGKTILDKATCHTKSLLQKSEDRAKALEKEVNSLQWELSLIQIQMKESEQSWKHKFNRILSENETLTENLKEREMENQHLRAENSALRQQCVELLSMLNVKEQLVYEETKPQQSPEREAGVLQLAVLGACRCVGVAEVCPCGWTAAASRKQLVQLQHELNSVRLRREEALMVADAFRIAFEQQLRTRSEHLMLLAKAKVLKSNHCKAEGANRSPLVSVGQRLRGLLPSGLDMKSPDDLLQTLHHLLDLLNDKEEALAHQRKVSIMLAHSADELQKRLHGNSERRPAEARTPSEQEQDPSEPQKQTSEQQKQTQTSSENSHDTQNQDLPQCNSTEQLQQESQESTIQVLIDNDNQFSTNLPG
ncbi:coiled-coil domain-containing protein 125 [Sphaeramia orbicularis]|uniref:coiled-coil domain-containing protein 125 n=1 Tax=Sphaeramia orbicularis TaxID=375764 RepID=UPI0011811018|nr:coiled-coil domain-containing protein 125 [Sphaeramia orbicularis]